ncbi:hypothetical protein HDU90_002096 [Geranomyces variabilis]|nr:hypothetical protein HDU90_002096 [Geranomyces variabilis]
MLNTYERKRDQTRLGRPARSPPRANLEQTVEVIDFATHFDHDDPTHDPMERVLCIRTSYADKQTVLKVRPTMNRSLNNF